ncbi:hypothetical protein SESBI_30779 [Sesbania bispinosa]|nr:hypothetical protein SESBI_30779 [Sesbania bispinosa]
MEKDQLILLDSFPSPRKKAWRKRQVKRVSSSQKPIVSEFKIIVPEDLGMQAEGSNDCGVWVAQWMNQCILYQDINEYKEIKVNIESRMRIAIDLVMGDYNKLKDDVVHRAWLLWNKKMDERKLLP